MAKFLGMADRALRSCPLSTIRRSASELEEFARQFPSSARAVGLLLDVYRMEIRRRLIAQVAAERRFAAAYAEAVAR